MNIKSVLFIFLLLPTLVICQTNRAYYGAKFEKRNQVLIGVGQNSTKDFMAFCNALDNEIKPAIYMDYFDVKNADPDRYFDSLEIKLKSIPWKVMLQLGLNMSDEHSKPYDSLVAKGEYDKNIQIIANRLKRLKRPVFLRIGYEFNGSWNGYTPSFYIESFKRIISIFRRNDVKNVSAVWCAEAGEIKDDYMKFYPGGEYVDWWAIDFFSTSDFTNPPALQFTKDAATHLKPIMIGESTPRYTTTLKGENSWNEWFVPYFHYIETNPNVKAFCYINWLWEKYAKMYGTNWASWGDCRIEKSPYISQKLKEKLEGKMYYKIK